MTKRINVKYQRALAHVPGASIKEFLVTILSEAKRPQIQLFEPKGEFWVCSEANFRMVKNYFRGAEWVLGNSPLSGEERVFQRSGAD